jgi:hypothetical protein
MRPCLLHLANGTPSTRIEILSSRQSAAAVFESTYQQLTALTVKNPDPLNKDLHRHNTQVVSGP